jgi:hypothetical protein
MRAVPQRIPSAKFGSTGAPSSLAHSTGAGVSAGIAALNKVENLGMRVLHPRDLLSEEEQ